MPIDGALDGLRLLGFKEGQEPFLAIAVGCQALLWLYSGICMALIFGQVAAAPRCPSSAPVERCPHPHGGAPYFSRNALAKLSLMGSSRYCIKVRSPVLISTSAGMPG